MKSQTIQGGEEAQKKGSYLFDAVEQMCIGHYEDLLVWALLKSEDKYLQQNINLHNAASASFGGWFHASSTVTEKVSERTPAYEVVGHSTTLRCSFCFCVDPTIKALL